MAILQHTHHDDCCVAVERAPFGPHFARLMCKDHHKHIQWLTRRDAVFLARHYGGELFYSVTSSSFDKEKKEVL